MRRTISIAGICLLAVLCTALPAGAQCNLAGTTWAFQLADGYGYATIGVFRLVGAGPVGQLYLMESFDNNGNVQQETGLNNPNPSSIYILDTPVSQIPAPQPCTGQINLPGAANVFQLRFVVSPGGNQMYLASTTPIANGPANHSTGTAVLLPSQSPGCGAGGNTSFGPGTTWSFMVHDYLRNATIGYFVTPDPFGGRPMPPGWNSMGVLESVANFPSGDQNYVHGSYKVTQDANGNCWGGTLQYNNGYRTHWFAFVYAGAPATASEIFMVDLGSDSTAGIFGKAVRNPI